MELRKEREVCSSDEIDGAYAQFDVCCLVARLPQTRMESTDAYIDFNKEYVVFGREKDYLKYREQIPQNIGIICDDNLYGFGYITKIMRECVRSSS